MVIDTLREQWARIGKLDKQIGEIEQRSGIRKTWPANALPTSLAWDC